ncbi:MAG: Gfo/Idh/MocA family oxidoreductase [Phycisphaerales bacterium]|nr:Gfo/Idh/MocA family oxidoreductase [Phycisphaerales bacterium]
MIHIGFIGAGGIARERHLPNLAKIPGVKVVAVANRSLASGQKIAKDYNISEVLDDWRKLLSRKDIDAIFIGTWPYMHKEMSIAALEANKHVFCQARMAMDLAEAKAMVAAAHAHPRQVNMICPPPTRMPFEPYIKQLIASGELGTITAVELYAVGGANLNQTAISWRERREYSGNQILAMGIYAETLNAWLGPYEDLSARLATPIPTKTDPTVNGGAPYPIQIPQVVTITGKLKNGALIFEHHTGLATDKSSPGARLTIWGTNGTLRYTFSNTIEFAKLNHPLTPVNVPASLQRNWHVEEDFIAAVQSVQQGKPWQVSPDFDESLLYMQKVEAVHLSAATGKAIQPADL